MEFPGKDYNYPRQKRRSNISIKGIARVTLLLGKYMAEAHSKRHRVQVLYATETGNSERYAQRVAKFLSRVAVVKVANMENYDINKVKPQPPVLAFILTNIFFIYSWHKKKL